MAVDVFLYPGEPNPKDIRLGNPLVLRGAALAGAVALSLSAAASLGAAAPLAGDVGLSVQTAATLGAASQLAGDASLSIETAANLFARAGLSGAVTLAIEPAGAFRPVGPAAALAGGLNLSLTTRVFDGSDLYIAIDGVPRLVGEATGILISSLTITDLLDNTPNTCAFTAIGFVPTIGQRVVIAFDGPDNPNRLFAGTILTCQQGYLDNPAKTPLFACSCIDDTWRLNTRKVIKRYLSQSASPIAFALIAAYAPGFTAGKVAVGLPAVDEITFTNVDLTDALTQLAKRIGAHWDLDYFGDLVMAITEGGTNPRDLTPTHPSLKDLTSTRDLGPEINRVFVEGGGVTAVSALVPGDTILPVDDAAWYQPTGGVVACGPQRLTYTATTPGGGGTLVGPGAAPSVAPSVTVAPGSGLGIGGYTYAYSDQTTSGESLPSALATLAVGLTGLTPSPSASPTPGAPTAGAGPEAGTHDYEATFVTATGETTPGPSSGTVITAGAFLAAPSIPPTASTNSFAHAQTAGHYRTAYTFVSVSGETTLSPIVDFDMGGSDYMLWSVPTGPAGTIARKLYRTAVNDTVLKLAQTVSDNSTTGFGNFVTDGGLGAVAPGVNTTAMCAIVLTAIPLGPAGVVSRRLYRRFNGAGAFKLVSTIPDNTTTTYSDTMLNASLGAAAPSTNTATIPAGNRVAVANIAVGSAAVIARKLYRTSVNGSQLKLLTTIPNNTATTFLDTLADGSLGANAPVADTSGLTQPQGQVLAGSPTLLVAGAGGFVPTGGWAIVGNGSQAVRYTAISGNTLTGIPTSGPGSITATIAYNSQITAAPALVGIPASGPGAIIYPILKGDQVNLLVQVDNVGAQATLSALLDPQNLLGGAAGIREDYLQDGRIGYTEARARGMAQLALRAAEALSVAYTCRDPLTRSGATITIAMPAPTNIAATLKIQSVTINNFSGIPGRFPLYSVLASSSRFSFEDLLRMARTP